MILCPDCRVPVASLDADGCSSCSWQSDRVEGIPVFLSSNDRGGGLFPEYLANYDRIAGDDLDASIQDPSFLEQEADELESHIGPVAGKSVLDVGVGQGVLFDRLRRLQPAQLVGVDISVAYLRRYAGANGTRVVLANAENMPFRDEFDLAVAADVLEHVLNVSDMLVSLNEALVQGGTLAVRVPYKDNLLQYARLRGCKYDMVHLRNFAEDNLTDLLAHAGFEVQRLHYGGFAVYRPRPYVVATEAGRRLWAIAGRHLPQRADGFLSLGPRLGRLLTVPVVVTAIARKR